MAKTVQIRDLSDETYAVLRSRAAADDLSLTQYLRRELNRVASMPTMEELLERADRRRTRMGGGVDRTEFQDVLDASHADRR